MSSSISSKTGFFLQPHSYNIWCPPILPNGYRGYFPRRGRKRPKGEGDRSSPSSAEIKTRGVHILSPYAPSRNLTFTFGQP